MVRQPVAEPVEAHQPSKSRWNFIYKSHYLGNYIRSSTKYSQLKFFFKTRISFSQGKFLLAECEVLACSADGRDKGASELTRCVRGCGSVMPASKLAAQHSPCTLLRRLPSRDNSSKRVKLLRLMGSPFSLHPIPATLCCGKFWILGRNKVCYIARG